VTGEWPKPEIDHINIDRPDTRWGNLRVASSSQNHANTPTPAANVSGFKGVGWHKGRRKWRARIKVNCKECHLGLATAEDAHAVYCEAARKHYGEFARFE
jgi:hypothetical protein